MRRKRSVRGGGDGCGRRRGGGGESIFILKALHIFGRGGGAALYDAHCVMLVHDFVCMYSVYMGLCLTLWGGGGVRYPPPVGRLNVETTYVRCRKNSLPAPRENSGKMVWFDHKQIPQNRNFVWSHLLTHVVRTVPVSSIITWMKYQKSFDALLYILHLESDRKTLWLGHSHQLLLRYVLHQPRETKKNIEQTRQKMQKIELSIPCYWTRWRTFITYRYCFNIITLARKRNTEKTLGGVDSKIHCMAALSPIARLRLEISASKRLICAGFRLSTAIICMCWFLRLCQVQQTTK